jgi:hypothetical protein
LAIEDLARIEETISSAHDHLRIYAVCEAESGTEVVRVEFAFLARYPIHAGENGAAVQGQTGDLRGQKSFEVETVGDAVVTFRVRGFKVLAEAEIQRQLWIHPPVFLNETGDVFILERERAGVAEAARIRYAKQQRGHPGPGSVARAGSEWIGLREGGTECERAGRAVARRKLIDPCKPEIDAELQAMRSNQLGHGHQNRVKIVGDLLERGANLRGRRQLHSAVALSR